jgi:hypothetical protein
MAKRVRVMISSKLDTADFGLFSKNPHTPGRTASGTSSVITARDASHQPSLSRDRAGRAGRAAMRKQRYGHVEVRQLSSREFSSPPAAERRSADGPGEAARTGASIDDARGVSGSSPA